MTDRVGKLNLSHNKYSIAYLVHYGLPAQALKIILTSVGTRGDMEPFLAIAEILEEKGHQVICAFPDQFRDLVEDAGHEFASLGTKFIEMLKSDLGKEALGGSGSGLRKLLAYIKIAFKQGTVNKEFVSKQYEIIEAEKPDRIVHNGKAIFPVIWSIAHPGKTTLISPVPYLHYVKGHTHLAFNSNYGEYLNKMTFALANYGLVKTLVNSLKYLNSTPSISPKQIKNALSVNKVVYTISPSLFARPTYWPDHMQVLGYHERKSASNWKPSDQILNFLNRHNKLLFISFGSMLNPDPHEKTAIFLRILEKNKIPAIVNTASGGLIKPKDYNSEIIHFVDHIPYEWIFAKIYAVIHHGGSGTTHMAIKYACPSLILPHIIDQFVWNKMIYERGIGPLGIKIGKVSEQNMEPKILDLFYNKTYKANVQVLSLTVQKEDYRQRLYESIVNG